MKLAWSRRARIDLREIIAYIAEDNAQAAEAVANRIFASVDLLLKFPRSGRPGRIAGTRERVVPDTPYILAYRVVSGRVRILRVYHAARKWPKEL